MLQVIDVAKSFGKTHVLEPTTVLLGPTGCGKNDGDAIRGTISERIDSLCDFRFAISRKLINC